MFVFVESVRKRTKMPYISLHRHCVTSHYGGQISQCEKKIAHKHRHNWMKIPSTITRKHLKFWSNDRSVCVAKWNEAKLERSVAEKKCAMYLHLFALRLPHCSTPLCAFVKYQSNFLAHLFPSHAYSLGRARNGKYENKATGNLNDQQLIQQLLVRTNVDTLQRT